MAHEKAAPRDQGADVDQLLGLSAVRRSIKNCPQRIYHYERSGPHGKTEGNCNGDPSQSDT